MITISIMSILISTINNNINSSRGDDNNIYNVNIDVEGNNDLIVKCNENVFF